MVTDDRELREILRAAKPDARLTPAAKSRIRRRLTERGLSFRSVAVAAPLLAALTAVAALKTSGPVWEVDPPVQIAVAQADRHRGELRTPQGSVPGGGESPGSEVLADTSALRLALDQLRSGQPQAALRTVRTARSPSMDPELALVELECLVVLARFEEALRVLEGLIGRLELASRHDELFVLRLELLARNGRCAEVARQQIPANLPSGLRSRANAVCRSAP